MSEEIYSARAQVANLSHGAKPDALEAAYNRLQTAILERAVRKAVEAAPLVNAAQRKAIAKILTGGAKK